MPAKIAKIGMETELSSYKSINRIGHNNEYIDYKGIMVCQDDEFYSEQIEYKMFPTEFNDEVDNKIALFKEFVLSKAEEGAYLNGRNWTWTHIHLFLELNNKPLTTMRNCKVTIINYLLKEVVKFISSLYEDDDFVINQLLAFELQRLVLSHNIWRNFDSEIGDMLRSNLKMYYSDYTMFQKGTDRKKYQPVIWSFENAETGKPLSLELRLFPNLMIMRTPSEYIKEILSNVESMVNSYSKPWTPQYELEIKEISFNHLKLSAILFWDYTNREKVKEILKTKFDF